MRIISFYILPSASKSAPSGRDDFKKLLRPGNAWGAKAVAGATKASKRRCAFIVMFVELRFSLSTDDAAVTVLTSRR